MAQFDASINLSVENRAALKGVTQVEGGVNKLIKGVKEFERVFNDVLKKPKKIQSRFQLEQERKALAIFNRQNEALAKQFRLAAQLGRAFQQLQVTELRRLERVRTSQKALTGQSALNQKRLPAAGQSSSTKFGAEQVAAIRAEAQVRDALVKEAQQQLAADNRITAAKIKIAQAAEGEVSNVVRRGASGSNRRLLPAAGQTGGKPVASEEIQALQRAAADAERANLAELERRNRAVRALADAREKLARAARGEASAATRTAAAPQPFGLLEPARGQRTTAAPVGSFGGRGFQQRLQAEVDRQIRVTGKLSNEILETVAKYNKVQTSADRLVKTQGRLSTQLSKAAKTAGRRGGGGGAGGGLAGGIGFPLLFGSGPGSVIGGAIGSAGGFGTQILASAIGGIIDQAIAGVAKLGQALNPLTADIDAVIAAAGESGTEFEKLVKELEKVAGAEKALAAATAQLEIAIGQKGVEALREFGDESAELGRTFAETLSQISAAVASLINNSGILTALAERIERTSLINKAVQNPNQSDDLRDLVQERARANRGEGERTLNEINEGIVAEQKKLDIEKKTAAVEEIISNSVAERTPEVQAQLNLLNAQIDLERSGLDLTTETGLKLAEKVIQQETYVELQQAINSGVSTEAILLKQTLKLQRLRNQAAADIDAKNRKAETAAERAARKAAAAAKKARRLQADLKSESIKQLNTANQIIELRFGETIAIEDQKAVLDEIYDTKADIIKLTVEDLNLQNSRLLTLKAEKDLEKEKLDARERALEVSKQQAALQRTQERDALRSSLVQELQGLQLGTGNPFVDERAQLKLQQDNRAIEVVRGIENQIASLEIDLAGANNKEQEDAINARIQGLEDLRSEYEALLPAIFAAEEQQLAFNQALSLVQGPVNSLVSGLREVVAGTKSAEEAFADFLNTIADQLVNTAATMIAQFIAIGIARRFALGGTPDTPSLDRSGGGTPLGPLLGSMPFKGFAEGGFVTSPTAAVVGEGDEPEYVIPASKMESSLARYSAGARGDSVISNDGSVGGGGSSGGGGNNVFTLETVVINRQEYATVEQVRAMGDRAAKQGAVGGYAKSMNSLKNSRAQRSQLGL